MLQACLNGGRTREEHPAVPVTPAELAADARRAVEAGADELHVHPRAADGRETLEPEAVAAVVVAIRESCPGVPLGLTTGLWTAADDAERRLRLVASWGELPDYVSANVDEPGLGELCELVARRGLGTEAGVSTPGEVPVLARNGVEWMRVLVEPADADFGDLVGGARLIERALLDAGVAAPQLHHGAGRETWRVLAAARERGHDTRVGLEDTTVLADGSTAHDNAELVAAAGMP
jgi:uncharacterized protein (DUF849 family)